MADIKIGRMVIGSNQTNCYFLYREGEPQTVVIDPADQGANIYGALQKNGFTVAGILLTHGHFDHIWTPCGTQPTQRRRRTAETLCLCTPARRSVSF